MFGESLIIGASRVLGAAYLPAQDTASLQQEALAQHCAEQCVEHAYRVQKEMKNVTPSPLRLEGPVVKDITKDDFWQKNFKKKVIDTSPDEGCS